MSDTADLELISYFQPYLPVIAHASYFSGRAVITRFSQRVDFYSGNARLSTVHFPGFYLAKTMQLDECALVAMPINSAHFLVFEEDSFKFRKVPLPLQPIDFFCAPACKYVAVLVKGAVMIFDKGDMSLFYRISCEDNRRLDCLCNPAGEITYIVLSGREKIELIALGDQSQFIEEQGSASFWGEYIVFIAGHTVQLYDVSCNFVTNWPLKKFADNVVVLNASMALLCGGMVTSLLSLHEEVIIYKATFNSLSSELAGACFCEGRLCMYERLSVGREYDLPSNNSDIYILSEGMNIQQNAAGCMLQSSHGIEFVNFVYASQTRANDRAEQCQNEKAEAISQITIQKRLKAAGNENYFNLVYNGTLLEFSHDNALITAFSGDASCFCVADAGQCETRCYRDGRLAKQLPLALGATQVGGMFFLAFPNGFAVLNRDFYCLRTLPYAIGTKSVQMGEVGRNLFCIVGGSYAVVLSAELLVLAQRTLDAYVVRANASAGCIYLIHYKQYQALDSQLATVEKSTFAGSTFRAHKVGGALGRIGMYGCNLYSSGDREALCYFDSCERTGRVLMFARCQIFQEWDTVRVLNQFDKPYAALD